MSCVVWRCRKRLQNAALVQTLALLEPMATHLIKQGPQAHAQPFGGLAPVPVSRLERRRDRLALSGRGGGGETAPPAARVGRRRRGGDGPPAQVLRLEDLPIGKHRRPLDGVLELSHGLWAPLRRAPRNAAPVARCPRAARVAGAARSIRR